MNIIVKMKIKFHHTLLEFIGNFESILKVIQEKENLLDHCDHFSPLALLSCLPIECSLVGVYEYEAFFYYQNEVVNSMKYVIRIVSDIEFKVLLKKL